MELSINTTETVYTTEIRPIAPQVTAERPKETKHGRHQLLPFAITRSPT